MNKTNKILLVGSGRSGTSWLGSMLDSYDNVEYYYETMMFPEFQIGETDFYKIKYPLTFWLKKKNKRIKVLEKKLLFLLHNLGIKKNYIAKSLRINPNLIFDKNMPNEELFKEVHIIKVAFDINRLCNIGNYKIIHLIRNPLSYVVSEQRQQGKKLSSAQKYFKSRLKELLNEKKAEKYHDLIKVNLGKGFVAHIVLLWWIGNELMVEQNSIPSYLITYENLCNDTEELLKGIYCFLDWDFNQQTKNYLNEITKVEKYEEGEWSLNKDSNFTMNRWKNELNEEDYVLIMSILKDCKLLSLWPEKTFEY